MSADCLDRVLSIACRLQYWTTNERQCQVPDDNLSAYCYHDKDPKKQDGGQKTQNLRSQYYLIKQQYVESRGGTWSLPNKRTDRLRDSLKELEEILKSHTVLHIRWEKYNSLQLVIHTGLIVNLLLSDALDIQKIFYDKSLVAKIQPELGSIGSAHLTDKFCLLCFDERNRLGYVSFVQRPGTPDHKQISSKISSMDMKFSFISIPGTRTQRGSRKLCVNRTNDLAICWSSSHTTPSNSQSNADDEQKTNMILLRCSFGRLELYSAIYTESNLFSVEFSFKNPNQVHSLERAMTSNNEVSVNYAIYECAQSKLQRLEINRIPVKGGVLSSALNKNEDKLAIGCTDGTVLVYDILTHSTSSVRESLVPSVISWHPNGGIVMVASGNAEFRCYDCALGKLSTVLTDDMEKDSENSILKLSKFLTTDNGLVSLTWPNYQVGGAGEPSDYNRNVSSCHDTALVLFDGGPFAVLKLNLGVMSKGLVRPIEIIKEHVCHENIGAAIRVLHTINWNSDCSQAFLGMISVVNHLLKKPLTFIREEQLESALSAFYTPKNPINQTVVVEYRHVVSRYARRFYHHLLRFKRFDKAFLLAKDIQDYDLFVDLYFYAKECGETIIAKAAKQKLFELYSSSDDEDSMSDDDMNIPRRKESGTQRITHVIKRKNKPFKATSPRIRKEIVPPTYPPPKMDDFMKSLISETRAVLDGKTTTPKDPTENLPGAGGSSLKILDYGYV